MIDEDIKKMKDILSQPEKETFLRYHKIGLIIVKGGYNKSKQKDKNGETPKQRILRELCISSQTFKNMVYLADEKNLTSAMSDSPSYHAWEMRYSKISKKQIESGMYKETETWCISGHWGCPHDCIYCWARGFGYRSRPTNEDGVPYEDNNLACWDCYLRRTHIHMKVLNEESIPDDDIVFVDGDSDIAFLPDDVINHIIYLIKERNQKNNSKQIFLFQSKNPRTFKRFVKLLPENCYLDITLETNRDAGYENISKAPKPSERFKVYKEIDYDKKLLTIEPVLDFDIDEFLEMIKEINPLWIWVGYANQKTSREIMNIIKEPSEEKLKLFLDKLEELGIEIKRKDLREIK
jgi:DNA repair photolyase